MLCNILCIFCYTIWCKYNFYLKNITEGRLLELDKFIINSGKRLSGTVNISGAKNAAVAILPATIFAEGPCTLYNVPEINDVSIDLKILNEMGAEVKIINKNTIRIDTSHIRDTVVPYELARSMRASYYFLSTMLCRNG